MYPHLNLNTDTDIYIYVLADTDNSGPISSFHPQLRACTGCNVWPCGGTRQAWHLWSSGRLVAGAGTLLAAWCIGGLVPLGSARFYEVCHRRWVGRGSSPVWRLARTAASACSCTGLLQTLHPTAYFSSSAYSYRQPIRLAGSWWLVLVCYEKNVLLAGCWWLVCSAGWWLISQANRASVTILL
jgi:hypothetical protein